MSNTINTQMPPPVATGLAGGGRADGPARPDNAPRPDVTGIKPDEVTPDQLAMGYAVRAPDVRQLEPLVSPPKLQDFEMRPPSLFPGVTGLTNPSVAPPAGIDSLRATFPTAVPIEAGVAPDMGRIEPGSGVSVTINRAAVAMEASAAESGEDARPVSAKPRISEPVEAAETAAIARDQIRFEPREAIGAQANSTRENVLALLK